MRGGGGPLFLEFRTYRFRAHSMFDPQLYRDKQEVEEWKKRDPILTYGAHLRELGLLDDDVLKGIEDDVAAEVDKSVEFAEAGTWEPVEDVTRFVYSERLVDSDRTRHMSAEASQAQHRPHHLSRSDAPGDARCADSRSGACS